MITWIQNSFQKHHKWLFGILIVVIVVAFVLTIGEQSFFGGPQVQEQRRLDFFGHNLASERQAQQIFLAGQISASYDRRQQMVFGNSLEDYALARTAALHMADRTGIPDPSPEQLRTFLQEKPMFQDGNGRFSQTRFNAFADGMKMDPRVTEAMIVDTIAEDWRISRVAQTTAGPGYTHPHEATMQFLEENSVWEIEVATWDYEQFEPEIRPSEEDLNAYYNQNPSRYQEPEHIRIALVEFSRERFLSDVPEVSESELKAYFERNRHRFADPDDEESDDEDRSLESVRDEVVDAMKRARARRLAAEAAESFTVALFRQGIPRDSEAFDEAVAAYNGNIRELEPYSRASLPARTGVPTHILTAAFNLDDRGYFSQIAETDQGAAILVYRERIPARIPPFEEVADAVRGDYVRDERRRLFVEAGADVRRYLEESVAFGSSIRETAEAEGLRVRSFEPFLGSQPPEGFNPQDLQHAAHLAPGQVADMIFEQFQGRFVFLKDRQSPEVDRDSPEIADMIDRMNEFMGNADAWMLFAQMARAEYSRADTGGFQPQR